MGFDTSGKASGSLVYPDKKQRQIPLTALDKKVPRGAQDDPQIKEMQAWYRKLDAEKAEKEKMIAEIREKQKTSKDPVLEMKVATLNNDVKMITGNQTKATETVTKRVEEVKKEILNKGLVWDESPMPATTDSQESVKAPGSLKLDFIRN